MLKGKAIEFFKMLCTQQETALLEQTLKRCYPAIFKKDYNELYILVTMEEVRIALFQMGSFKALGIYGFHAVFFQKNVACSRATDLGIRR